MIIKIANNKSNYYKENQLSYITIYKDYICSKKNIESSNFILVSEELEVLEQYGRSLIFHKIYFTFLSLNKKK